MSFLIPPPSYSTLEEALIAPVPLSGLAESPTSFYRRRGKRLLDLVLGSLLLLASSPIILFLALWVKIASPGPVFYRSWRVGKDGKLFCCWKLRTMYSEYHLTAQELKDRNDCEGVLFKIRQDPRLAPGGAQMRRLSLDELPQFWNVVRGEMSLVGPRPLPAENYQSCTAAPSDILARCQVLPGITGPWQVSGRCELSSQSMLALDTQYVANYSLLVDLIVLSKTIPAVISKKGAY